YGPDRERTTSSASSTSRKPRCRNSEIGAPRPSRLNCVLRTPTEGAHFARILLHELRPHALLPAGHVLADKRAVSLAELAAHPLITTEQPHSWQHMLD
ncbi:hypothetical protein EN842_55675, partial [bacterium M00.F.Ca.ET.199.01.1.1]